MTQTSETHASGTFDTEMSAEPPYDEVEGVTLSQMSFEKTFHGALEATSEVQALAVRTPIEGSAVYVALERIRGTLEGRAGSFVAAHLGVRQGGEESLTLPIAPDSGTGALRGIRGTMTITIDDEGQHHYTIDYTLDEE
jgi:hypothetical protein